MNLEHSKRSRNLSSFACSNLVAGEGIDIEGPGYRCARQQVENEFVDPGKLFVGVALGIFLTFPKAQRKDLVGLGIRYKQNLVNESLLIFKDRKDLVVNGFGELSSLFQVWY